MSNQRKSPTDEQLARFIRCYEVYGEGKARVRLHQLVKEPLFQENLKRLANLKVSK